MSTKVLSIDAVQPPIYIGVDGLKRAMFSINFMSEVQAPLVSWAMCIVVLLNAAGLGTAGTDIFIGAAEALPTGAGPYISIIATGGAATKFSHGPGGSKYVRPSVQVVVTATRYEVAEARAQAVQNALDGVRNVTVAA